MKKFPLIFVLDNIRSAYNVGSVFRTADCCGAEAVYTCGYTPTITHPKVQKTALSSQQWVKSQHFESLSTAIDILQKEGYKIIVLECSPESTSLWEAEIPLGPTALILGNEVSGVQLEVTRQYNLPELALPMFGGKESLNVSSTAAIAGYDLVKRWSK